MNAKVHALLLSLFAAGCGAPIAYDYRREPDPRLHEYVIGVADQLKITVWKNPELSADGAVRPDGVITLPLLGDVKAVGLTPSLKQEVAKRLQAFVRDEGATVSVAVSGMNSYRFSVSGNVEHAGVFTSRYYVTVAEALALAGGPNKFASRRMVLLRTGDDGKLRRIPLDYERVTSGEHPEENLALVPGDNLVLP